MALEKKNSNSPYYDESETLDRELREEKTFNEFSKRLKKITSLSKGWMQLLKEINLDNIKTRDDFKNIPITRKSSLTDLQKISLPYGNLTTKPATEFPYMFASPGPIYEPGDKNDFWNMSRSLYAAGLRRKDIVYNTFSYHLGPAGLMMHNAVNNLGATAIPGGVGNTDLQVETISNLKPSFYIGTPSFLKIIIDKARDKNQDISFLKKGLVGAEPLPNSLRSSLLSKGVDVLQMYGTAEVGCIAYETKDFNNNLVDGMIIEENIILEIVRPGTLEALPAGEVGEVVITKIKTDYPIIRLGTGDLSKIIEEPSPCGRTNFRIQGWMGRAEQATKFKGIFVNPKQFNEVLRNFKEISKVRFLITTNDFLDEGELMCESNYDHEDLAKKIKEFFKTHFKLNIKVSLTKCGSIKNDGLVIEDKRQLK